MEFMNNAVNKSLNSKICLLKVDYVSGLNNMEVILGYLQS